MCHLEEPRAHSHQRPKAVTESQPFVLLARSWTQGLWGVWGPCITYDTVRDPHRQISQSLFASLVHPHLVRMQSQSTDEVTIYLGSPWATGKPFGVAFKPSIPLQSLRAPSPPLCPWPLETFTCKSCCTRSPCQPPYRCCLIPFWSIALSVLPSPMSFWTEPHCIAQPSLEIMVLLPQPPDFWDHKHRLPCPTSIFFVFPCISQLITL